MEAPQRHRTRWTEDDLEVASVLMREGHTNREIAKLIGRTESTTNVMFYRMGLHRGLETCLHCGVELLQPTVGRKRRFCGVECRTTYVQARLRADREAELDATRCCAACGEPIPLERQRKASTVVIYCSRTCSQDAWYARRCAAQGRVPRKTGPRVKPDQETSTRALSPTTTTL